VARSENIPLVAITETLPPGKTYQAWISAELDALQSALSPAAATQ
jgi:zinc/manganese transport system substrate-binding protein